MCIPILDCDNTLYRSDEMFEMIGKRIIEFMKTRLNYPNTEDIHNIRKNYWRNYGTTLSGLIRHSNVKPTDYLDYIHDFDLKDYVKPNPELRNLLNSIPKKKIIMSNAPRKHVLEVLDILNISDIPDKIFTIEDFDYDGKPFESSYRYVFQKSEIDGSNTILFDDSEQNLHGAKKVGMKTCIVGRIKNNGFDYQINDISDIMKVFK